MARDPRYDILFEPIRIGPVTLKNRFYQVPHCNGLGWVRPRAHAAMREVKAEGGWAAVCTESISIHKTSDTMPWTQSRLWNDSDMRALALLTDAIHRHGALAGAELAHNGHGASNRHTREIPLGPSHIPTNRDPVQARAMDKSDILEYRRWHRDAALRAKQAGFDIVYVYAADDFELLQYFLSRRHNHRTDEYGGKLENRVRLLREVIEETRDAVGDRCAVAVRLTVDERAGDLGLLSGAEGHDIVEMLAELPDLWDVKVSPDAEDACSSRFGREGFQEPYIAFVKKVTSKPVVGVGRFTSPDTMVAQIRQGIVDIIGAARPSIADPFLPKKIEEGRIEDIRECIGCNICLASFFTAAPIRCTQNPTMGEELRRGWHPERVDPRASDAAVLVVGAGPAGLECAHILGRRGYRVELSEATNNLGGRVTLESRLPGFAEWIRVRDYRVQQIAKLPNVHVYRESKLDEEQIAELEVTHVVIATGSSWRRDGVGRYHHSAIPVTAAPIAYTPDDILADRPIDGPVIVFDDDHYYMGGAIAERLRRKRLEVTLVTPAPIVSEWTVFTLEQERIQANLIDLGVEIVSNAAVTAMHGRDIEITCRFTRRQHRREARSLVLVTARLPNDRLFDRLSTLLAKQRHPTISTVRRIGDCLAPGTIGEAVFGGHRCGRDLDEPRDAEKLADEAIVGQMTGAR